MAYERIIKRIAYIENQLRLFNEWMPENQESYLNNLQLQAAMEHTIQNIIEAIFQICVQFVNYFHLGPPKSEESIIELLKSKLPHYEIIIAPSPNLKGLNPLSLL